jgi:hypothetical protein
VLVELFPGVAELFVDIGPRRLSGNERRAWAELEKIHCYQVLFKRSTGRYAFTLKELYEKESLHKPNINMHGERVYRAYLYKLYLSNDNRNWCAYAWPIEYDVTGTHTYFTCTNYPGIKVYATDNKHYSGPGKGPKVGDAYKGKPFESEIDTSKWKLLPD